VRRLNADDLKLAGGDNGHYPSSWYNKAKNPVRPPTTHGNHAAAKDASTRPWLKSQLLSTERRAESLHPRTQNHLLHAPIRKKRRLTEAASMTIAPAKTVCAMSFWYCIR